MLAVTETFAIPAALALGAPNLAIAILGGLPLCLGALGQLALSTMIRPGQPRRPFVLSGVVAQSAMLLLCAGAGFVVSVPAWWVFIPAFIVFGISGNVISMFWISWMRDLTPPTLRGRIFAGRNRVFALVQLSCAFGLGLLSRNYTTERSPWAFFATIFALAGLCRSLSGLMLSRQYEPEREPQKTSLRPVGARPEFMGFCVATALVQGATAISGPFFNVWFLRDLGFDYLSFSLCGVATLLGTLCFVPIWGRLADRVGNFRLLVGSAIAVSIVPLPYLVFDTPQAVWALNFYSGAVWSAYNLVHFNTLLESANPDAPERDIAFAIALTGIAVFVCGLIGGVLATRVAPVFGWQLRTVFLVSALGRIAVVFGLFLRLRPTVPQPAARALDVFYEFPGYRAGMGMLRGVFRAFRRQ